MKKMKKALTIAVVLLIQLAIVPHTAFAATACCTNNASYQSYDFGSNTCIYWDDPACNDLNNPACSRTAAANNCPADAAGNAVDCDPDGGNTNGSPTYSCKAQLQDYPGACCDYTTAGLIYNASTNSCEINGTKISNSLCAADAVCKQAGVTADQRPLYMCSAGSQQLGTVICDGVADPKIRCINTAIGQFRTDPQGFFSQIMVIGVGFGSGIAFLILIYGSYKLLTSQGNPDAINGGKELITSAIIGLVFIALSLSILQIIGFDILGLGGLGLGSR